MRRCELSRVEEEGRRLDLDHHSHMPGRVLAAQSSQGPANHYGWVPTIYYSTFRGYRNASETDLGCRTAGRVSWEAPYYDDSVKGRTNRRLGRYRVDANQTSEHYGEWVWDLGFGVWSTRAVLSAWWERQRVIGRCGRWRMMSLVR